jgi:uncharacterized membrane protein YgcG
VELATIEQGRVVARDTIDASGARRSSDAPGCPAWRSAEWSRDTRRVYLRSETACASTPVRTSTGLLAMLRMGDWLAVHTVSVGAGSSVRTTRYREVTSSSVSVPDEFAAIASRNAQARYNARTHAGSDVNPADVIEAASRVDSLAMQAWIAERRQRFDLDAATLIALADGGVAASVTDVMVAVTYPQLFRLARTATEPDVSPPIAPEPVYRRDVASRYSGYDYNYGDYYYGGSYCYGGHYCYGGNYHRYGYDGYYSPYGGGGSYTPVVVTRQPELPHGRAVKGRGYTADRDPLADVSTGSSSSGGSTSRASASSSSGSSSSGKSSGSSTGRTAQKKGGGG